MNKLLATFKAAVLIFALSVFFSLVLPYPFNVHKWSCAEPCQRITDYSTHEETEWAWFGGYHIFIEHFFFFDSMDRLYLGFSYLGVVGYAFVSVIFAGCSYFGIRRIVTMKTLNRPT